MILYIAMAVSEEDYSSRAEGFFKHKHCFERLSGRPCLIRWCYEVDPDFVARYPFTGIFVSGFGKGWDEMDLPRLYGLYDLLHSTDLPVLAACGGHQLLAYFFSRDFRQVERLEDEPIRRLAPHEADFNPGYHPGWYTETGMQPVRILRSDPLFARLPKTIMVLEAHYCEVKNLPPDFELLATNDNCRIQAMRHRERPLYGVQFHPEGYTEYYSDGRIILENFFALAKAGQQRP